MLKVEIRVKDHLDPHWSEWLEGLTIARAGQEESLLTGAAADQAALYGLLTKIRDLGLTLISVSIQGPDDCDQWEIDEAFGMNPAGSGAGEQRDIGANAVEKGE